jgi:mono/diheme cytochrome c family protein
MRKLLIITGCIAMVAVMVSCNKTRRSTGRAYMPDMYYSRAYETYAGLDTSKFTTDRNDWGAGKEDKIFYNNQPVTGTIARGDMAAYPYHNDSTGYAQSAMIKNPLDSSTIDLKEAERLYLVNCGICHGPKLDGNGPLWKGGDGPYPSAPKNFMDAAMKTMPEGTMFHSVTYGKNMMGSYASQLNTKQRWMVIAYIKSQQAGSSAAVPTATPDSTATVKPAK